MLLAWLRPVSVAVLLSAAFLVPAAAQDQSGKEAWAELRSAARERGILIASQGQTDFGTSMVAQNVRIFSQADPEALVITIPELRVEPRGGATALIPSPRFTASVVLDGGSQRDFAVTHDGEIVFDASEDVFVLNTMFNRLSVALVHSARNGMPMDEAFDASFDGLTLDLRAERQGTAALALASAAVRYAFRLTDLSSGTPMSQSADAEMSGVRIEFTGTELDRLSSDAGMLRQAFDAGLNAQLVFAAASSAGTSEQIIDGRTINVDTTSGPNEVSISIADGTATVLTSAQRAQFQGGMTPFQGGLSVESFGLALGFPLLATRNDQEMFYRINLDSVLLTPQALQMIGAQDFAGEPITFGLDISAQGRLMQDFGPEFGQGAQPPMDLSSLSLDRLVLRVGNAELTGSGAFSFLGGMISSVSGGFPTGTGDFVIELLGGDAFLTRLSALGLVPQDQQFFVRMMMNGLGRQIGVDHLRSEIAIRPGSGVTVNGAPLPF